MTQRTDATRMMDYRDLVGRLDFGRARGVDVSFSPEEAWVLREHIRALDRLASDASARAYRFPPQMPERGRGV